MNFSFRSQEWEFIFAKRARKEVFWSLASSQSSLLMIEHAALSLSAEVLDLGGSDSFLAEQLLQKGFLRVTVADFRPKELKEAKVRTGLDGQPIRWASLKSDLFSSGQHFDLWHDRSIFPLLIDQQAVELYARMAAAYVRKGGNLIVSAYCPEKPGSGSFWKYELVDLAAIFAPEFELEESRYEDHFSPSGQTHRQVIGRFTRK